MDSAKRVLVIEPDRMMRRKIGGLLKNIGCDVTCARAEAVPGAPVVDVVVCDWKAWDAVASQFRFPGAPPVVLMTAAPNEQEWINALRRGAFDFVEEPHSEDAVREFTRVVTAALAAHRAPQGRGGALHQYRENPAAAPVVGVSRREGGIRC